MSITLYRKYRPQGFADLTGQNHIKITIGNEIAMGAVAHAYLFTGPRGVGKTTTARILAKAVNCEARKPDESEPCQKCEACVSITENRALDVIEIDAASHTGVDNVRENIIENARFTPSRLKNKVFIIDEVHMLSSSAWNALLKTLEEPPERVILILATTEVAKVPATIISRCQRFDFHRINAESLVARLARIAEAENITIDKDVLYSIARHADGGLRDAESMLGQIMAIGEAKITAEVASIVLPHSSFGEVLSFMDIISRRSGGEALVAIGKLAEEGVDTRVFTDELIEFGRKLLLTKFSGTLAEFAVGFDTEMADKIMGYAKALEVADIVRLLEGLLKAREASSKAKISQLPLEMALVEFCERISRVEPVFTNLPKVESAPPHKGAEKENVPAPKAEAAAVQKKVKEEKSFGSAQEKTEKKEEPKEDQHKPALDLKPAEDIKEELFKIEPSPAPNIDLNNFLDLWPEFVRKVQAQIPSLSMTLGISKPLALLGDVLQVGVEYKIHADRLNDIKNRKVLELVLTEISGSPMRIEGVVAKLPEDPGSAGALMKKALETFGGRVVG